MVSSNKLNFCLLLLSLIHLELYRTKLLSSLLLLGIDSIFTFISYCCCDKLSHSLWHNTIHLLSYSSGSWNSKNGSPGTKIKMLAGLCSFQRLWGECISCPFKLLEISHILWLMAAFQLCHYSNIRFVTSSQILILLPPCYKDPCDYTGPPGWSSMIILSEDS